MKLPPFLARRGHVVVVLLVLAFAPSAEAEGGTEEYFAAKARLGTPSLAGSWRSSKNSSNNLRHENDSLVSASTRSLQNTCTQSFAQFTGVEKLLGGLSDNAKNWLETDSVDAPINFVEELVTLFYNDQIRSDTGANIRNLDGDYSEVCNRLPLDDDTCYFVANPNSSFLEYLVAKFVPFGDKIVEAKRTVEEFIENIEDKVEDIRDFILAEKEDTGLCAVINDDMIGIADNPGLPSPWIYEFCNCITVFTNGAPLCTVQPYFRGFALSLNGSDALKFDIGDRLDTDQKFFDGFVE
jgi:hypothetical protein